MNNLNDFIKQSISEDCPTIDITTSSINLVNQNIEAKLIAKENGIFFGHNIIKSAVNLYSNMTEKNTIKDGSYLKKGDIISLISGQHNDILLLERTLLNFIQHLSGIATSTQKAVQTLNNPKISICDTRKTIPGFRKLAKAAVKAGGGKNHREGLSDMILIKENHLTILEKENRLDQLSSYIKTAKNQSASLKAQIEIETVSQLKEFDLTIFDYILLDNFSIDDIPNAVEIALKHNFNGEIECSGNITHNNLSNYTHLPIQRISMGCLTHSVTAFDISLLL